MKRKPNETFEEYKLRRAEEQQTTKTKRKGKIFVVGRTIVEKDGKKVNIRPENFQGTIRKVKKP